MDLLKPLAKRAAKFQTGELVRESGLSRALIWSITSGRRTGVNLDSYAKLESAVSKLEANKKPSRKAAKKPSASKDNQDRRAAKGGA